MPKILVTSELDISSVLIQNDGGLIYSSIYDKILQKCCRKKRIVNIFLQNTDMSKFESSRKDESRAQSADSSKAHRKPRVFVWCINEL